MSPSGIVLADPQREGRVSLWSAKTEETPMCHTALLDAKFHAFLLPSDEDLAAETRARACRRAGAGCPAIAIRANRAAGRANRVKPRHRLSFTCSICDKRHTPASVRFLGRRVYLAATVVLASSVRTGLTGRR
jgi:hypothetical protein